MSTSIICVAPWFLKFYIGIERYVVSECVAWKCCGIAVFWRVCCSASWNFWVLAFSETRKTSANPENPENFVAFWWLRLTDWHHESTLSQVVYMWSTYRFFGTGSSKSVQCAYQLLQVLKGVRSNTSYLIFHWQKRRSVCTRDLAVRHHHGHSPPLIGPRFILHALAFTQHLAPFRYISLFMVLSSLLSYAFAFLVKYPRLVS